jgi:glycerophosphoryl diester phosphodiesterase
MWQTVRTILAGAAGDFRRAWRPLASTDLTYKLIAFAVLMPATTLLLFWLRAGTSNRVVADVDIAMFFLTTPAGITTLILGASLITAITALEIACLMVIGMGVMRGERIDLAGAMRFGAARALDVLRLTANMVVRVLFGLVPFALAGGVVYWWLLSDHDINFYLSERPPEFRTALALVIVFAVALLVLLARTVARWAFALPLVLFEKTSPRHALGESARQAAGSHLLILSTLGVWAVGAITLVAGSTWLLQWVGRAVAPMMAASLPLLLVFVAVFLLVLVASSLVVGIFNISMFALLLLRLHLHRIPTRSGATDLGRYVSARERRISRRALAGAMVVALLAAVGIGLLAFLVNRDPQPARVIAHRGASLVAPENTLAAFRLAAEQRADFVELDVQESLDGQVLVVHDSDLMKVGQSPLKIWEGDAAALRSIDIGTYRDARYAAERVPTLAEALEACRGRCRVIVELKSYGHNQQLEQRVVDIVEAAGMAADCEFMSLDLEMVRRMKALRPNWRVGLLVAKAMGDLTELNVDFLAVEARMATRRFVRRAHRANQDVYIWTVNDPAWAFVALSRGVDGLITDDPAGTRKVIELRERMSEPQRFLGAMLIRLGATAKALESQEALRP